MSEYQYYEFQAIDRPLTAREMNRLRASSTRATITPTRFVNHYEWGSFKGDVVVWIEKYFDAFVYVANWGTHELALRFPQAVLDLKTARRYVGRASFQIGVELPERQQMLARKGACFSPSRVENRRRVPLGEHKDVVVRRARLFHVIAHHVEEQRAHDLGARCAARWMPARGCSCRLDGIDPELRGNLIQDRRGPVRRARRTGGAGGGTHDTTSGWTVTLAVAAVCVLCRARRSAWSTADTNWPRDCTNISRTVRRRLP
jgi:hypothetical protein